MSSSDSSRVDSPPPPLRRRLHSPQRASNSERALPSAAPSSDSSSPHPTRAANKEALLSLLSTDEVCETGQTQELLDGFFALYTPASSESNETQRRKKSSRKETQERQEEATQVTDEGNGSLEASPTLEGEETEDDEEDYSPVGRADGRHGQQSQCVPEDTEELEEENADDAGDENAAKEALQSDDAIYVSSASSSRAPSTDGVDAEVSAPSHAEGSAVLPTNAEASLPTSLHHRRPSATRDAAAATALPPPPPPPEPPSRTPPTNASAFWPFPHPPPLTPDLQRVATGAASRAGYHTKRYGAFIKAYLGLSDTEVRQAERRGRGICMIGVRKVLAKSSAATAAASVTSPTCMPFPMSSATSTSPLSLHGRLRPHSMETVKTQRVFLRHSVLAVEGDAVFGTLIDRAEALYAVEHQRLDTAAAHAQASSAESGDGCDGADLCSPKLPYSTLSYPQFRRLPRVTEPYLRPNARCIALHYGLPEATTSMKDSSTPISEGCASSSMRTPGGVDDAGNNSDSHAQRFPRATLIAVVSTTRLEEHTEIYVSLESYYRCLDEVAWYRRCYQHLNARCGCVKADGHQLPPASPLSPPSSPAAPFQKAEAGLNEVVRGELRGDVYTGVKRFTAWPAELAYYHGVGRRHASRVAEAAFPFTLVDLGAAPELGENQKGVTATAWLPYGTCLLYCGPSVATRKVERLVSARALGGGALEAGAGDAAAEDGGEAEDEEDLSFAMDDTYALGLGRHGVCFGQGLTRYINHRYNTTRFGNVELCSVMLSVPSEFGEEEQQQQRSSSRRSGGNGGPRSSAGAEAQYVELEVGNADTSTAGEAAKTPFDPSLTDEQNRCLRKAAKQAWQKRRGSVVIGDPLASPSSSSPHSAKESVAATTTGPPQPQPQPRGKRRQPVAGRKQVYFLEEKSFFVTVPFFLVTTDIPPGCPLLAWTYGEDYDAKLERHAVAAGHLVPYADAALLNQRLLKCAPSTSSPGAASSSSIPRPRFQRYGGDYRFAVGLGDVVWRRRPFQLSSCPTCSTAAMAASSSSLLYGSSFAGCRDQQTLSSCSSLWCGRTDGVTAPPLAHVPLPEDDLFVVVQTQRAQVEQVLLQALEWEALTDEQLGRLLVQQRLSQYVSPHASRQQQEQPGEKMPSSSRARGRGRDRARTAVPKWTPHWAVFLLPENNLTSASVKAEEALRRCVVATIETVGLLQPDIDYSLIHEPPPAPRRGADEEPDNAVQQLHRRRAGKSTAQSVNRMIVVNLDDLHHATALVRSSPARAAAVPPLFTGLMWPLLGA